MNGVVGGRGGERDWCTKAAKAGGCVCRGMGVGMCGREGEKHKGDIDRRCFSVWMGWGVVRGD